MATYSASCSKVGSFNYASNFTLYVVLTERDVSVANNTSYVDYNVYCRSSGSGSLDSNHYEYFDIFGQRIKDETIKVTVSGPNANIPIASGSIGPIEHNSDGSKVIGFGAEIRATAYGVSASLADNFTLTTIPRTSTISLSSSSVTLGNSVTINTNRASTSFTHNLYYQIDNGSWNTIATGVGASYAWTTPLSIANSIPNASSKTITIIGETYNGSTYIGSSTTSLSVSVPSSVVPTISSFSLSGSISGTWVETLCNVTASSAGSGAYSSTITSYKVEMLKGSSVLKTGYGTSVTFDTNNLNISANTDITMRLTIIDSRGRTATRSTTINVKKYTKPVITSRSAYRCTSDGTRDENGTYIKIAWAYSTTSISGVTSDTAQVKYRKSGTSSWTNVSVPNAGSTIVSGISTDSAYEVNYSISDSRNTTSATDTISTGYVTIDYRSGGKGIAFGKVSEKDAFECNMNAEMKNIKSYSNTLYLDSSKESGSSVFLSYMRNGSRKAFVGFGSDNSNVFHIYNETGDKVYLNTNLQWITYSTSNINVNDLKDSGMYYCGTGCSNLPKGGSYVKIIVNGNNSNDIAQIAIYLDGISSTFVRRCNSGTWSAWRCLSKASLTAGLSSRPTITGTAWTAQKITLNQVTSDMSGGLLWLNNGGIKVGNGVSSVRISARIGYYNYNQVGETDLSIYKNSTSVLNAYGSCKVTNYIESINLNPVTISVSPEDTLYLYITKNTASDMTLLAEMNATNLTIEVV